MVNSEHFEASDVLGDVEVFLSYARVDRQPADNSCWYHALSYCLAAEDLFDDVYDRNDGFELRSSVNSYIRDNGSVDINLAPDVRTSITEAVLMEGYSCQAYSQLMSNINEWGGVVEIATVAEMFSVNVCVFVPVINSRLYKWLGTFRCTNSSAATTDINILYTGLNHYDSLTNVVYKDVNTSKGKEVEDVNDHEVVTDTRRTSLPRLAYGMQQFDKDLNEQLNMKRKSRPSRKNEYAILEEMEEQLNMKRKSRPSRKKEYAILEEMEAQEAKKKRKLNYEKNCTSNEQSALEAEKVQTSKGRRKELDKKRNDENKVKSRKISDVRAHDVLGETKKKSSEVRNRTKREVYALQRKKSPSERVQASKGRRKELDKKRNDENKVKSRKITDVQTHDELCKAKKKTSEVRNNTKREKYALHRKKSPSAIDASLYERNYDDESRDIVCAICGHEGSQIGSKLVDDYFDLIKMSGIQEKYKIVTSIHSCRTEYEKVFNGEVLRHFDGGLIKGLKELCSICSRQLRKQTKKVEAELNHDDSDDNDEEECINSEDHNKRGHCEATQGSNIPKLALFLGLFCSSIPDELIGLTAVEDSMINIYSAITKVFLAGGKHYKLKGGTYYTMT
jgi:hypothetical protein